VRSPRSPRYSISSRTRRSTTRSIAARIAPPPRIASPNPLEGVLVTNAPAFGVEIAEAAVATADSRA
jgi:hypothetical protein